jgi:hypothetical protein
MRLWGDLWLGKVHEHDRLVKALHRLKADLKPFAGEHSRAGGPDLRPKVTEEEVGLVALHELQDVLRIRECDLRKDPVRKHVVVHALLLSLLELDEEFLGAQIRRKPDSGPAALTTDQSPLVLDRVLAPETALT